MRNMMKKRIALACMLAVGVSAVAGGVAANVSAGAEGSTFTLYDGASIRTANPAGIRFETTISGEEYEAYVAQEAKFGTVIIPESKLGENTLEVGLAGSLNIVAENFVEVVEDNEETTDINESVMQYNAVLVGAYNSETGTYAGLPKEMYNVKLVARSYVQVGTEAPVYATNTVTRSMAQVAGKAIADTTETYDADEYEYMHDITEYVATLGANTLTAVKVNTVKETLNASISLPDACGEVYGVYVMANDSTVPTSAYAVEGNVVTFTDAFLKSLDYGKYTLKINAENGCYSVETEMYGEVADEAHALNFATNNSVANMTYDGATAWLPTFNGSNGVVSSVISDQWAGLKLKLSYTLEELQGMTWDYFAIRAYVENGNGSVYTANWPSGFAKDAWKTVMLTKANVETLYGSVDEFYQLLINGGVLFKFWDTCTIYVTYADFKTEADVAFTGVEEFNSEDSSAYAYYGTKGGEYLTEYEGAKGVVKGAYNGTDPDWIGIQFRINSTVEKMAALDWDYVEFKVAVDFTGSRTSWDGLYSNAAGWKYTTDGVWRIYKADKSGIELQYGSLDNFYKAITVGTGAADSSRLFVLWNMTAHGNFYFDYFALKSYDYAGEIDFASADEISCVKKGMNIEWKESITGTVNSKVTEYGVVEFNHTATQYDGIVVSYANTKNITVDDWDVITIRIRILRGESAGGEYNEANTSGYGSEGSFQSGWYVGGVSVDASALGGGVVGWSTLTITKDMLTASGSAWEGDINAFWTALTSENGAQLAAVDWVHATGASGEGWIFQIAHIGFLNV